MSAVVTSLWPTDIKVDVLTPRAILKRQAAELRNITRGALDADVVTTTGQEDFVVHRLEIVAPRLGGRRYGILVVTHRANSYPVVIEADVYRPRPQSGLTDTFVSAALSRELANLSSVVSGLHRPEPSWPPFGDWRPVANDQDEFLKHLGEVLKSPSVRATIDSLLALTNEQDQPPDTETAA